MASNFNPMEEDYKDMNFNSYVNQGFKVHTSTVTRNQQLMSEAQSQTLELHVSRYFWTQWILECNIYSLIDCRIPIELSEIGLKNLFGQFGAVLKIFVAKPKPVSFLKIIKSFYSTILNLF